MNIRIGIIIATFTISILGSSFLLVEGSESLPLHYKNFYYNVEYAATNGITINSIDVSEQTSTILISLKAESEGTFSIDIPFALMQARYKCQPSGFIDSPFIVVDEREIDFTLNIDEKTDQKTIPLFIPIPKNTTKLEIIFSADMGSWAFPDGCPIELFENAIPYTFAESEKEYRYFDDFGYHLIPYNMTKGEITKIERYCQDHALIINVQTYGDGTINLTIPKSFMDWRSEEFFLLGDGAEINYNKIVSADELNLTFEYEDGITEIELVGTIIDSPLIQQLRCTTAPVYSKYYEFKMNNLRELLHQADYQTYEILFKDRKYLIPYHISGNNLVESMTLDAASHSVLIKINPAEDGSLVIKIPYEFAKIPTSNHVYYPLVDNISADFELHERRALTTYLLIPFKKENSEIEITPSYDLSTWCGSRDSKIAIQIACGFDNEDVICAINYQKIFKKSNNFPACVKPETREKIIERGWANPV